MRRALLLLPLCASLASAAPPAPLSVSAETLKAFETIEALAAQAEYVKAEEKIHALLPSFKDEPNVRALLLRNLATLYGLQKHYAHAAETLQQSLALHAQSDADSAKTWLELGQYYLAAGAYDKAAKALADAPSPTTEQFLLLADIHTRLKHYPEAAAWLEKAIAGSSRPKQEWRQQLLGLYHESRNLDGCAQILTDMIANEPNQALYWNQLTGIYQEVGKDLHAIAVRQLMHKQGLLKKPDEIVQLARVLQYHNLPGRAAELLDSEIKAGGIAASPANLEQLADAWTEARELQKAAAALEKTVALAATGDRYLRLGQIYSELKEWPKARQALTQALAHGDLKNPGGTYLLLGLAHYKLNAKDQARAAFEKARVAPNVRATAQQWLDHLAKK